MKNIFLCTLFLILCTSSFAQELEGTWQGRIVFMAKDALVFFHFKQEPDKTFTATMSNPDQGSKKIDAGDVEVKGDSLLMNISTMNSTFEAKYFSDSAAYIGVLKQYGFKIPLKLVKGEAEDLLFKRSQRISKPYPYVETEVTVLNKQAGITLAGTFTKPKGKGKFPAVILISGSGPQDRDESVFGHKPFLVLADYLTRKGFAVLRCDDRGTAKSTGNFSSATSADFATDVAAQLDYLSARADVDKKRIGLLGHSEGGVIAPIVAAKRTEVAFIVMLAGVGVGMFENLYVQDSLVAVSEGYTKEGLENYLYQQKTMFEMMTTAKDSATAAEKLFLYLSGSGAGDKMINAAIKQLCSPWMRWYVGYDPAEKLKKVQCAVLAINGEKDIQVPAARNISAIEKTLRESGNKNFKTEILPGLNHLFQRCTKCSVTEYREIEETINPAALELIGEWLEKYILANSNHIGK